MLYSFFWVIPRLLNLHADVSEHSVCSTKNSDAGVITQKERIQMSGALRDCPKGKKFKLEQNFRYLLGNLHEHVDCSVL